MYGGPKGHTRDAITTSLIIRQTVSMREVIERALSLNARPLHALLASTTCIARLHAPLQHAAAFDSLPNSPTLVCIAHLREHTPENM